METKLFGLLRTILRSFHHSSTEEVSVVSSHPSPGTVNLTLTAVSVNWWSSTQKTANLKTFLILTHGTFHGPYIIHELFTINETKILDQVEHSILTHYLLTFVFEIKDENVKDPVK